MTAAQVTVVFGPVAVLVCAMAWIQRYSWRQPPKTPQQARARNMWAVMWPLSQFGVRVGPDGFVYANATAKCLGQAGGATATVVKSVPVTKLKPSTGWCVITFADGTSHRQFFGLRNLAEAQAQADRFNQIGQQQAQANFRRTWTPASRP